MQSAFFDATLFNVVAGDGLIPILKKNFNAFALFPFINTPSQIIKRRFLYIPLPSFHYKPPFCPPNSLLINHIFGGNVKSIIRV